MTQNDIFRRLRFIFGLNDANIVELFALTGHGPSKELVQDWLRKEDDPDFCPMDDYDLAVFLNGLIIQKRGKKDENAPVVIEDKLNNNIIFRKLKIALDLKDVDILEMMQLADMPISKHELSALFRNPKQSQYRACNDQMLRNFLLGMQKRMGKK